MSNNIEVEIRSFISEEKYRELIAFFMKNAEFVNEDYQETFYFNAKGQDLRIQKNNFFSKIWMKKGKIHDEAREELEIRFPKEDFVKLEQLFLSLGFDVEIKWFRNRHTFEWGDGTDKISVMIDYTRGYGYIIELEKMASESEKGRTILFLKEKLAELDIPLTQKEVFEEKYDNYKKNWRGLILN